MPVTVSYDLEAAGNNHHAYIRSMFERYGWRRFGGSLLRYDGRIVGGEKQEDWLNDVAPALMFFRSYLLRHNLTLKFFTLDSASVAFLDHSDPAAPVGNSPFTGANLALLPPAFPQAPEGTVRGFVDAAAAAI